MALNLNHQTKEDFATRFWQRLIRQYQEGNKLEFARMIWWLYARVTDGDFTSNQVRLTFNDAYSRSLNPSQWNTLVTDRLMPIAQRYQAMLDEGDL